MRYDFDAPVHRRGTNCFKWDVCAEGVLPLWVADMDFRAAPAIVDALCRRAEEGVYGYALPPAAWHESLAKTSCLLVAVISMGRTFGRTRV